ncbi:ribosome recycling factor [Victivallis sp. Marseille-Q1083]|uniref:ribosome recycling factor n=1 Tax=Victivallis sp. Marseille-Q1083 TaxID=2717288 RepID=UPI00158F2874|nr:ribosome recycling factor [Victivallis sp. Marseille-Q1083]
MSESNISELLPQLKAHMAKAEEAMRHDFAAVRTGKASPALVEGILVDYYGAPTRLRDLANISAPEARLLTIQPYDISAVHAIEKAIIASNLGIMPNSDGKILRLPIPELSEERRIALVKQVKQRAEEGKVAIRNLRRDANDSAKKAQKGGELTEDELKKLLDDIQKLTDRSIEDIDKSVASKEKELMSI